jgi:hypothetical protein
MQCRGRYPAVRDAVEMLSGVRSMPKYWCWVLDILLVEEKAKQHKAIQ